MYSIETEIEFIAPFLYNRPKDERGPGGTKSEAKYLEEARLNVHRGKDGLLIIPAWSIKVAIVEACKKTFKGKQSITDLVKAYLFPRDVAFNVREVDFIHECWGRVPPRTGALVKVYRPSMNAGTKAALFMDVADDRIPEDKLRLGLEQCGLLVGIGSWRPENGRFLVRKWDLSGAEQSNAKHSAAKRTGVSK